MISVLIPVYNYNITALVLEIHKQLVIKKIAYEFICIDDNSTVFYYENLELTSVDNLKFVQLEKNIGRSKIRNLLAKMAIYDWFLFLDSDSFPVKSNFISEYLNAINDFEKKIFCGGVKYKNELPQKESILRWKVGKSREEVRFEEKLKFPNRYFFTANFIIHRSIFKNHEFDEKILKYGYEDFLFAQDLRKSKIEIIHINNPICHLEDEQTIVFIKKVKESIINLLDLSTDERMKTSNLKILSIFLSAKKYYLSLFLGCCFSIFQKKMEKNLMSLNPSLRVFDFYRLSYLCFIDRTIPIDV